MSLWLLLFGHTDRISATGLPTNHFFFFPMLITLLKAPLRGFRPSMNAALILRSFGEAHLRRVHASTHIHTHTHAGTQQDTGSIPERRERSFFGLTIRRQTRWFFSHCVTFVTRLSLTAAEWSRAPQSRPDSEARHTDPPCTGRRTPRWPRRLQLQPAPRQDVKELRRKSLRQGRRLRQWLENGLFEQHDPRGWTSTTAAPEPYPAGGCPSAAAPLLSASTGPVSRVTSRCWCWAPAGGGGSRQRRCRAWSHRRRLSQVVAVYCVQISC